MAAFKADFRTYTKASSSAVSSKASAKIAPQIGLVRLDLLGEPAALLGSSGLRRDGRGAHETQAGVGRRHVIKRGKIAYGGLPRACPPSPSAAFVGRGFAR